MIGALPLALALAFVPGASAAKEVAVDAGPMTGDLVALLRFERPDLAFTASTATASTRISLKRDRELLSLAVLENGVPRTERLITVDRERLRPALRVAALLVVEALAPRAALVPPDFSSTAPKWLSASVAAESELWLQPLAP